MSEQEWLECNDSLQMLDSLWMKTTDRKWRLYFCGGCRQIRDLFFRTWSIEAVETAERFADGQATEEERHSARWGAEAATFGYEFNNEHWPPTDPYRIEVVPRLIEMGALPRILRPGEPWHLDEATANRLIAAASLAEYSACIFSFKQDTDWFLRNVPQVNWPGRWLIDCIFGNPFWPIPFDSGCLAWQNGAVGKYAQQAYEERALPSGELDCVRLAKLADALESAGCATPELVEHLRSPGPHMRGCWAVDLMLGRP